MTMASETTALVMCIYRRPHLLEGALRDLRAQSRRADQVVLINNPPYAPHPSVAVAGQRIKGPNMQRECLVVCSPLPGYFGRRSEDRNVAALVEEYEAGFAGNTA
jgi:hypothetical protein